MGLKNSKNHRGARAQCQFVDSHRFHTGVCYNAGCEAEFSKPKEKLTVSCIIKTAGLFEIYAVWANEINDKERGAQMVPINLISPKTGQHNFRMLLKLLSVIVGPVTLLTLALGLLPGLGVVQPKIALAQSSSNGVVTHTTIADFQACGVLTNAVVTGYNDGEIRLVPLLADHFPGTKLDNTRWLSGSINSGYGVFPSVANSLVTLDNSWVRSKTNFSQTRIALESRIRFGDPNTGWGDFGFGKPNQVGGYPNGLFITDDNMNLFANSYHPSNPGPTRHLISGVSISEFHTFRVVVDQWQTFDYYVDGVLRRTHSFATPVFTQPAFIWLYTINTGRTIDSDWVRVDYYEEPNGTHVSCVQDAGQVVNWTTLNWAADEPAATSLSFRTRTSIDGNSWSNWSAPLSGSGADITSPSGRYFQYMAELATTDVVASPELQQVTIQYLGPSSLLLSPISAALNPNASQQFNAQIYDDNNRPIQGLAYNWQVINGGGTINNSGLFTAALSAGSYTNTVRVTAEGMTEYATIIVHNLPPQANAGGPYAGSEGQFLPLTGSASDPNGDSLTFAWDLDNDGQFDDASGASISHLWPDDGLYNAALRVTDSWGLSQTTTTTANIANLPPVISSVSQSGLTEDGNPVTVTINATDPGADVLSYSFDWENDGSYDIVDQSGNAAVHIYPSSGLYTVRVRVRDGDGGETINTATKILISKNIYTTFLPLILH